jgi:hypothetical protein
VINRHYAQSTTFEELWLIANYATISVRMISSMLTADSNSDWKSLYEAAVCETDRSKLAERVATARSAILSHIEESLRNPAVGEHCAMDAALRNLRRLAKSLQAISYMPQQNYAAAKVEHSEKVLSVSFVADN